MKQVKFVTSAQDRTPQVFATLEIDDDGDLVLKLNDTRILYIDSRTGKLERFSTARNVAENLGITLDNDYQIAVK